MRETKVFCDKCKKEIEGRTFTLNAQEYFTGTDVKFDLCPNCYDEVWHFIMVVVKK